MWLRHLIEMEKQAAIGRVTEEMSKMLEEMSRIRPYVAPELTRHVAPELPRSSLARRVVGAATAAPRRIVRGARQAMRRRLGQLFPLR
jgi:hypothetical protein